jgi:hypothetical protein
VQKGELQSLDLKYVSTNINSYCTSQRKAA